MKNHSLLSSVGKNVRLYELNSGWSRVRILGPEYDFSVEDVGVVVGTVDKGRGFESWLD